jgi:hypothetical protein
MANGDAEEKQKKVFDVLFYLPKQRLYRVMATDEDNAADVAGDLCCTQVRIMTPDKRRRVVYELVPGRGVIPVRPHNKER